MGHVVLLGDSIFDNAAYVPGGPAVADQVRGALPKGWSATLCAVDGAVTDEVAGQLGRIPEGATHLAVSVGGNDALRLGGELLREPAGSVVDALERLAAVSDEFRRSYRAMLGAVVARRLPVAVCTVYDAIPGLSGAERAGLCVFNDVITREAFRIGLPLIDLRLICDEPTDYAAVSPIEPSVTGGKKIASAVARAFAGDRGLGRVVAT